MKVIPSLSWNWLRVLLPSPTLLQPGARERGSSGLNERRQVVVVVEMVKGGVEGRNGRSHSTIETWNTCLFYLGNAVTPRLWVNKDIGILIDHVERCVRVRFSFDNWIRSICNSVKGSSLGGRIKRIATLFYYIREKLLLWARNKDEIFTLFSLSLSFSFGKQILESRNQIFSNCVRSRKRKNDDELPFIFLRGGNFAFVGGAGFFTRLPGNRNTAWMILKCIVHWHKTLPFVRSSLHLHGN